MKFDKLSNEEIAFIYLVIDDMLLSHSDIIDEGGITYVVDSPVGKIEIFKEFSKEDIEILSNSLKLKLLRQITGKFKPVIDLIEESNEEAINNVRDALFPIIDEDDSEEEEDM